MKLTTISQVETFRVDYSTRGHFKFFESRPGETPRRATVVVKITAENGMVGWGQCVPSPRWSYETVETVESTIRQYLAPLLLGQSPLDAEALHARLNQGIAPSFSTGQPICKAGLDLALFDLTCKLLGQTAAQRWQRDDQRTITLSWTLNPTSLADAEQQVAEAQGRGYRHFNLKVAPDARFDLDYCRLVRRLAPDAVLWADANGGYDLETALVMAPRLAELGLIAFEQPVAANRLSDLARLKRQAALPIVLDEPLVSVVELAEFHQLRLLDGAAIKVSRCGGLAEARRQIEYLEQHGLLFLGSGLTDPDLSLSASALLFGAYGLKVPAALNGPQYLTGSILETPLVARGDRLELPGGPGLGTVGQPICDPFAGVSAL